MKKLLWIIWCWTIYVSAAETDYDCIVVGTNPLCMLEAIYKRCLGERVLVVEQAAECGGAWKSIDICGISRVDLGCHEFGNDTQVQKFLEEYVGCQILSPHLMQKKGRGSSGFYPSQGCYELIHHLEQLMQAMGVILALNTKLETLFIDAEKQIAQVTLNGRRYTTAKIVLSHGSDIQIGNPQLSHFLHHPRSIQKYPHVYLLISDPTPSRFTYLYLGVHGASRAMNVTSFVGMEMSGLQLIVFQVSDSRHLEKGPLFLEELKKQNLISSEAQIVTSESYIFEQVSLNQMMILEAKKFSGNLFEIMNTSHITNMRMYIDKWKQVMTPWSQVMHPEIFYHTGLAPEIR